MKKTIFIIAFLIGSVMSQNVTAQNRAGVTINIGAQPIWGPVGYDYVEYYYLPDVDAYYYVPNHQYIYMQRGSWVFSRNLPPMYRNFDLYSGYKVVINEPKPYHNHGKHKEKYHGYKGNHSQQAIRNSSDSKYYVNKNHPEHKQGKKAANQGKKTGNNNGKHSKDKKN
jgi:hypothetical protein